MLQLFEKILGTLVIPEVVNKDIFQTIHSQSFKQEALQAKNKSLKN